MITSLSHDDDDELLGRARGYGLTRPSEYGVTRKGRSIIQHVQVAVTEIDAHTVTAVRAMQAMTGVINTAVTLAGNDAGKAALLAPILAKASERIGEVQNGLLRDQRR